MEVKMKEVNGTASGYDYQASSKIQIEVTASKTIVVQIRKAVMLVLDEEGE